MCFEVSSTIGHFIDVQHKVNQQAKALLNSFQSKCFSFNFHLVSELLTHFSFASFMTVISSPNVIPLKHGRSSIKVSKEKIEVDPSFEEEMIPHTKRNHFFLPMQIIQLLWIIQV